MNRKQLEQCAWEKTPRDERRATSARHDWKTKKTITKRLTGNEREVRVFDPSGHTEGTMSPWMPLWALYSDELEQRCKEEHEPKLRPPYHRVRSDYTGDVESSGSAHSAIKHATKRTPAQLDAEIAKVLAQKTVQNPHSVHTPEWERDRKVRKLQRQKMRLSTGKPPRAHATKRVPKTRLIWVVQGNYGHGWEDVTAAETWKEAKGYLRDYRENERGVPFRAIRRRERIEAAA